MSQSKMTRTQHAIIYGLFSVGIIISLIEFYTKNFFIQSMLMFVLIFAALILNQIFEQQQPLTQKQKNLLLFWSAWTGFILLMQLHAFIAVLAVPVFQMKHLREELEKNSPTR